MKIKTLGRVIGVVDATTVGLIGYCLFERIL